MSLREQYKHFIKEKIKGKDYGEIHDTFAAYYFKLLKNSSEDDIRKFQLLAQAMTKHNLKMRIMRMVNKL
jgi:hypothetical protein